MILRVLNWQGIAGIGAALALAVMLALQARETGRWKRESAAFEQRYRDEQTALGNAIAHVRAAADAARAADEANSARVLAEQRAITERTVNDFEERLAAARARAERLRIDAAATSHQSPGRDASVPAVPKSAPSAAEAAGQDGFPGADRLIATEQAIQLDELIKWVRAQAEVDNDAAPVASAGNQRAE